MKKIYKLSEKIALKKNVSQEKLFLALNTIFYFVIMLIISLPLLLTNNISLTTMIMLVGYPTMFFGFF